MIKINGKPITNLKQGIKQKLQSLTNTIKFEGEGTENYLNEKITIFEVIEEEGIVIVISEMSKIYLFKFKDSGTEQNNLTLLPIIGPNKEILSFNLSTECEITDTRNIIDIGYRIKRKKKKSENNDVSILVNILIYYQNQSYKRLYFTLDSHLKNKKNRNREKNVMILTFLEQVEFTEKEPEVDCLDVVHGEIIFFKVSN